jgi:hypothetical protein
MEVEEITSFSGQILWHKCSVCHEKYAPVDKDAAGSNSIVNVLETGIHGDKERNSSMI